MVYVILNWLTLPPMISYVSLLFDHLQSVLKLEDQQIKKWMHTLQGRKTVLGVIAGVWFLSALGLYFFPKRIGDFIVYRLSFSDLLVHFLGTTIGFSLFLWLTAWVIQRFLEPKLDLNDYAVVLGHASAVLALSFFPKLSFLGVLIFLYFVFQLAKRVFHFSEFLAWGLVVIWGLFFSVWGAF